MVYIKYSMVSIKKLAHAEDQEAGSQCLARQIFE